MDRPEAMTQDGAAHGQIVGASLIPERDDMKKAINNLIWMYCDPQLTIGEAEERACQIINLICDPPSQ